MPNIKTLNRHEWKLITRPSLSRKEGGVGTLHVYVCFALSLRSVFFEPLATCLDILITRWKSMCGWLFINEITNIHHVHQKMIYANLMKTYRLNESVTSINKFYDLEQEINPLTKRDRRRAIERILNKVFSSFLLHSTLQRESIKLKLLMDQQKLKVEMKLQSCRSLKVKSYNSHAESSIISRCSSRSRDIFTN